MIHLRARYLEPSIGSFIQADTWVGDSYHPISFHHYSYVRNNPINWTDPSGLCWYNPNSTEMERTICLQAWEARYGPVSTSDTAYWQALDYEVFKYRWNSTIRWDELGSILSAGVVLSVGDAALPFGEIIATCGVTAYVIYWYLTTPPPFDFHFAEINFDTQVVSMSLPKPSVYDPYLQNLVENMYKEGSKIGPHGSTADALREEARTGQKVGDRWHNQPTRDFARGLDRWIEDRYSEFIYGKLTADQMEKLAHDIEQAERLLRDLENAIEEWENRQGESGTQQGDE